jgi:hypothetical protein
MSFILIESGLAGGVENADTNGEATKTTFGIGKLFHSDLNYLEGFHKRTWQCRARAKYSSSDLFLLMVRFRLSSESGK